ncbi:DUF4337 domain-containing protein [Leptospira interrogans]
MALDDVAELAEVREKGARDRWIALYIGVLAVLLAVCALGGDNATKDATHKNIEASNTWSFFQAKNLRRQMLRLQIDDLTLQLAAQPDMPAEAKAAIEARIQAYKDQDKQLTSDPKSGEGLDELFTKGKTLEEARSVALEKDPYFDLGQAFLQIAIVLASVAIIAGTNFFVVLSVLVGIAGGVMTLNGYLLLWQIPYIG